jgi:hypothetical protein
MPRACPGLGDTNAVGRTLRRSLAFQQREEAMPSGSIPVVLASDVLRYRVAITGRCHRVGRLAPAAR